MYLIDPVSHSEPLQTLRTASGKKKQRLRVIPVFHSTIPFQWNSPLIHNGPSGMAFMTDSTIGFHIRWGDHWMVHRVFILYDGRQNITQHGRSSRQYDKGIEVRAGGGCARNDCRCACTGETEWAFPIPVT